MELYRSGRWQHYCSRERFAALMRDVIKAVSIWKRLAGEAPAADNKNVHPAT